MNHFSVPSASSYYESPSAVMEPMVRASATAGMEDLTAKLMEINPKFVDNSSKSFRKFVKKSSKVCRKSSNNQAKELPKGPQKSPKRKKPKRALKGRYVVFLYVVFLYVVYDKISSRFPQNFVKLS